MVGVGGVPAGGVPGVDGGVPGGGGGGVTLSPTADTLNWIKEPSDLPVNWI